MNVKEISSYLESIAPLQYQESYDNAGLVIGSDHAEVGGVLIALDITLEVIQEAIDKKCNLIICHHPPVFQGIKKINGKSLTEKILIQAIQNNIAIYAAHTNLDNMLHGVNAMLCEKIGVKNPKILKPVKGFLKKLVTFCPIDHADAVRQAIFQAGAGHIGNYDSCSYNIEGKGSFRALENANPFVGEVNKLHFEDEVRIESVFPVDKQSAVIAAMMRAHSYEEVAYDIYPLDNEYPKAGAGMIGQLDKPVKAEDFLDELKNMFSLKVIRHSALIDRPLQNIAVCGGGGSFLIHDAIVKGADVLVTGDIKYHQFYDAEGKILIVDIGHYESEQFTKELLYTLLIKKFPKFAVFIAKSCSNPVHYF